MMTKFWMMLIDPEVSNGKVTPQRVPHFVQETRESAERDAERLALQCAEWMRILEIVAWVHPKKRGLRGTEMLVPTYEL